MNSTLLPNYSITDLPILNVLNQAEFERYNLENKDVFRARKKLEEAIAKKYRGTSEMFKYAGFDKLENEAVEFYSNFDHSLNVDGQEVPNFRELTMSSKNWLSGRMRGVIHALGHLSKQYNIQFSDKDIYLSEQVTPFYKYFKSRYPKTIGSEYVSDNSLPGSINENDIRHEDIQKLSFDPQTFDLAISMEVLEHVPDYMSAFKSIFSILKPNAFFVFTVPFDKNITNHNIMAEVNNHGVIEYIKNPPEYHGDPMRPDEGALCYRYFGWKVLDELKEVGFQNVGSLFMYSYCHGIIGNQDFIVLYAQR